MELYFDVSKMAAAKDEPAVGDRIKSASSRYERIKTVGKGLLYTVGPAACNDTRLVLESALPALIFKDR